MKDRNERLKTIRGLIKKNKIDSQEMLLLLLEKSGFNVTQATLSRDLKFLKVGKISDGVSSYFFAMPSEEEQKESEAHYAQDFLRGFVSIGWSGHLAVVKTYSGHSDSVALAIDCMDMEEVLGTLAGRDNTVFIALRENTNRQSFVTHLKAKVPELLIE